MCDHVEGSPEADEVARDRLVISAATTGPWRVAYTDDDLAMNAILIVCDDAADELCDHGNNIAAILLQDPRYVCVEDGKWSENAEFIARARSRWPAALNRIAQLEKKIDELERRLQSTNQA